MLFMQNNENEVNGSSQTVEQEAPTTLASRTIADQISDILFGGTQEEQQPEGSQQTGEVQTEDKFEESSSDTESGWETSSEEEENLEPKAEDGEDQVHSQTNQDGQMEEEVLPNGVQKRINKLTARNKAYEEKISSLETKLTELEQKLSTDTKSTQEPTRVVTENPFSNLDTIEKVQAEAENARWLRFKCEENPDGFQLGDSYIDAEQVRKIKVNALRALEEDLPKQVQFIKSHSEFSAAATKEYPWWSKPETKEHKMAQEVLKNFPQFRNFPDFQLFVGDYVRGYMTRTNSKQQSAPARVAPALQVRPRVAPTQATTRESTDRGTYDRFVKSGGKEGLAKILLQKGFV
jgi:hypothetical protein